MSSSNRLPNEYQCRHIFPDGARCGSPRMRNEDHCYYHHESRGPIRDPYTRNARRSTFAPLPPSSFGTIQETLDQVLVRIASNDIDMRRAALLLYCLQIASTNLRHAQKTQPQASLPIEQWMHENAEEETPGAHAAEAESSPAVSTPPLNAEPKSNVELKPNAEPKSNAEPKPNAEPKSHGEQPGAPVPGTPQLQTRVNPTRQPGSAEAVCSPAAPSSADAATSESPQPAHHPQ